MLNKSLKKFTFFVFFCSAFVSLNTNAKGQKPTNKSGLEKSEKIEKIEILGLKKIEKEAVRNKISLQLGQSFSAEKASEDIQILYKMGYFDQIEIYKDKTSAGFSLVYQFVEKPTVAEILFEGNDEIKSEDLITQSGLKTFEVINYSKVQDAVEKIQKFYEEKGFYLVKVEPKVETANTETVKVKFSITENDKVKVKKITFIGNQKIKDSELKNDPRFFTKEAGYFSFMSSSGSYKQEAFDNDLQVLKYIYWNQGFLQVKIDRPLVTVTPDKKSIYVTYNIDEGDQFSVGEVDFAGDMLFSKSELYDAVKIKDNGIFSVDVMRKDILDLQAKYGDLGYAFTNVIPRYNFHEKEKKVDLVFEFEKGNKVYFGDFTVTGNTKTRDKVIRREMKIVEGELYNETRKRQSLENIQRLGFFEEVNFKTSTPAEKPDQLNIEVVIKERNTGQIQLTAAYGSVQGMSIGGSVTQNNFRGLGEALEARIDAAKKRQDYRLSLTDPYFNDTDWSAGFDVFYNENKEIDEYIIRKHGGNVRLGHPILGDYIRGFVRYKLDKTDLSSTQYTDPDIYPLETARGITSSVTLSLEYDTRNDRFSPSKGIFTDISYERAGLGGDLKYQEFSTHFRFFQKLFWDVVWRNNIGYSNILPIEAGKDIPFTETYRMGGAYTLRGYGYGGIGVRKYSTYAYNRLVGLGRSPQDAQKLSYLNVGGTKQLLFQSELQFPLIKEAGLSGVFFYDVGQAQYEIKQSDFMSDIGIGFRWMSPLGLLRFEWGWPLKKDAYNTDPVNFEFSIGPPF